MLVRQSFFIFPIISCLINQCTLQNNGETAQQVLDQYENVLKNSRLFEIPSYETSHSDARPQYDYIIVGAGSSGSVLANRLSTNPKIQVLLLEAGETPTRITEVPLTAMYLQFTSYNWHYLMEKQDNIGLGLIDQRMYYPRGKAVGGSSLINYMVYTRGNKHDYYRWAAMGNFGWSYNNVLWYFSKSESYHRNGSYVSVQEVPYKTESAHTYVRAAQQLGYPYVYYNGMDQIGISYVQATLRNCRRCSGEKAFIRPARHRPNLTILTKSYVTKVLINEVSKQAYGVEYIRNNQTFTVEAEREVILSAGAINSPKILMLSGIGPKEHLNELKIPLIKDLKVGQKLYDHVGFLGLLFKVDKPIALDVNNSFSETSLNEFVSQGIGPLTLVSGIEAVWFIKTKQAKYEQNYPDIELMSIAGGLHSVGESIYKHVYRLTDEVYNSVFKDLEHSYAWTVAPILLHPKSYGYIKLTSSNPLDPPKIYGNYFTDPENHDVKTLIAGVREAQKLAKTPAFQQYNCRQVNSTIPGCRHVEYNTDEYWECAIRHIGVTMYHPTSTCKMGPIFDPEAVVDHKLCVHAVKGLRVADTSVIPIPLSGHTNGPAHMIGEKAADLILTTNC